MTESFEILVAELLGVSEDEGVVREEEEGEGEGDEEGEEGEEE